ncbi:MAG: SH3 domain-containing protein, partial [Clostridia bacterium]|nr:SH3 domain-containing protein [Clostridia bacterium]
MLNQSMQVRSGPGTSYSGSGSRLESGTEISVLTSARDGSGSPWIQVEFPSQGNRKRGYVPAGCLSIDPGSLPGENTLGQYTVTQDCNGCFGPGQDYASQRVSVTSGTVVTVFAFENGYALVEFQANGDL